MKLRKEREIEKRRIKENPELYRDPWQDIDYDDDDDSGKEY